MDLIAVDQGAATLVAAVIAAVASTVTSIVALVPKYLEWKRLRALRAKLVGLLSGDRSVRSLEWLGRRLGVSRDEVAAMMVDVGAHGVRMADGEEGAALDSRHQGA
jgi:hypothetical protein